MSAADEPLNADEIAEVRSRVARCRAARKKPGRYTEFDSRILATIDLLTSRLDAATRRADEAVQLLRDVADAMLLHHSVRNQEETYRRGAGGVCAACEEYGEKHGKPATWIWHRIDAAKEGR